MHIEERTVDINKQEARAGQIKPIVLRRGETGQTQIKINITSDGAPYSLTSYTPKMCAFLPDNTFVKDSKNVTKSTNFVTYTVHADLTSAEGDIRVCYVELANGSEILTTDAIPIIVLADVSISGEQAEEYRNAIDDLMAEVEAQLKSVSDSEKAIQDAEAKRVTAEQGRVNAETSRVTAESGRVSAESTRQTNENARKSAETSRDTAEQARVKAEQGRVTAESGRVTAENGRVSAESARVTEQAKNNADQAANNLAAAQIAPHVCVSGEYANGKPTVKGSVEGRIYLVPTGASGDDKYTEWMWLNGAWEQVGTSSGGEIAYVTTDQIDNVIADKAPTGDTVLNLTGVSYFWAKIKEWAANTFRKAADAIGSTDIADGAITSGKIASSAVTNDKIAGTIPVNKGGTGATTLTSNQVVLGSGTSAMKTTSASGTGALYRTGTTSAPTFGTLPIEQGGTGQTTLDGAKDALGIKALESAWDSASSVHLPHLVFNTNTELAAGNSVTIGVLDNTPWITVMGRNGGIRYSATVRNESSVYIACPNSSGAISQLIWDGANGTLKNNSTGTLVVRDVWAWRQM